MNSHDPATAAAGTDPFADPRFRQRLARLDVLAGWLHQRGWTPATSSNFSFRVDAALCAVTASGGDKRTLGASDMVLMQPDGQLAAARDGRRPSAETELHLALYRRDPEIGAVLHTHAPSSVLTTRLHPERDAITFSGYELLKAFSGIDTHAGSVTLPVVDNDQDIDALARQVDERLDRTATPCWAYLIRDHGIYAWGADLDAALRHLEAADYLLNLELELSRLQGAS